MEDEEGNEVYSKGINYNTRRRAMVCFTKGFLEEERKDTWFLTIILKSSSVEEKKTKIPTKVQELLPKFQEVIFK